MIRKLTPVLILQEPGRRVSVAASKRGSIVGRRERTASVRSTTSQSTLAESISGRLSHGGSVSSVFRRMFSRDKGEKADLASPVDGRVIQNSIILTVKHLI